MIVENVFKIKNGESTSKGKRNIQETGSTYKLFDCYRPLDIQKKMWKNRIQNM
jgi:D-alanyl-D-alanine dipeptidase